MTSKMLEWIGWQKNDLQAGGILLQLFDEPNDMFGKIMSMKDELIDEYFELATRLV